MTIATDLPTVGRAFLDALAVGESGGKDDIAAYTVLFGGSHFTGFAAFPEWSGVEVGDSVTHAAGRYQFEPATWRGQQAKLGLPDFSPESQDRAAWDLAETVYKARTRLDLTTELADDLSGIAAALNSTWTSLSESTFAHRYAAALAAIDAA